jgi:hypothetical protein
MMRMSKYFLLLFILISFFGLLNSVDAFSIQKLDKNNVVYNTNDKWSYISVSIVSTNTGSDYKMKQDLNRVDKIVVKVNGKTIRSIEKEEEGSDWKKYYPVAIIKRNVVYTGNIKGKKVGIYAYDKNNKLIKSKIAKVTSVHSTKQITSEKEAKAYVKGELKKRKESQYLKVGKAYFGVNAYKQGYWLIDYIDTRTNKIAGQIPVSDRTGGLFTG